jgi:hypothetical protein
MVSASLSINATAIDAMSAGNLIPEDLLGRRKTAQQMIWAGKYNNKKLLMTAAETAF